MLLRFVFFKILPNKISIVLILNSKSCICCRKHCIAYFRRHMECAVLKRFLKVQGTFLKKFLQISLFHLEKIKFNLFYKNFDSPYPLCFAQHLLHKGEGFKTLPSSYACHLPFQGRLSIWEGSHERGAVTQ